jgi:predicted amidohydrolase YtcJ
VSHRRGDPWEAVFAPRLFGPERSQRIFQTRTLLNAGVQVVWGSDWPVTGVSALEGLETAVTHRYPGGIDPTGQADSVWNPLERLGLPEAIAAYTSTGAYLLHEEQLRGTIAVGKLADLVVVHANLFATPVLELHSVPVDLTIIDGKIVFSRTTH